MKSSISEAQCAENVLTIQKELNTLGHRYDITLVPLY